MTDDASVRFAALLARPDGLPLDEALLLIALHTDPSVEVDAARRALDDLAEGVADPTVDGVRAHLVDELGFAGDRATYYDARNSLLPSVLERRQGIPITLAVVAMEVGRRREVDLEGVAMPGHFLLRPTGDPHRYLDLYDGGRWLDAAGCRAVFEQVHPGGPWEERYLLPTTALSIVGRVLANLAGAHRRAGDRAGLCAALELALHLPTATDRERRELGLLLGASGRFDEGAAVLEASTEDRDNQAAVRMRARLN